MLPAIIKEFLQQHSYPELSPKAVFFDMDGVLFDSMPGHAVAWVKAMNDVNLPFTEYEAYMNEGRTGASTINNVFKKALGRDGTEEEIKNIYKLKSDYFDDYGKPKAMPYALELLSKIKAEDMQILVVTGSGQSSLLNNLESHFPGMFHPEKMITAFDVKHGKPDPEPFLMAVKKSGVRPWEAIAIDNAPLGVRSASSAGLFTIGLNTGPLKPEDLLENGAHIVINSMEELNTRWEEIIRKMKEVS